MGRDVLGRGDRLSIKLSADDEALSLEVQDSGPGIPEELTTKLFEPFVTAGKPHGTGLGLSIVKRFVDDHGGKIQVESKPGLGTTFQVHLPMASSKGN